MYINHKNPFRGSKKKQEQDSDKMIPGHTPGGWMKRERSSRNLTLGEECDCQKKRFLSWLGVETNVRRKKYTGDIKEIKLNRNKLQPQPWGLCEESEQKCTHTWNTMRGGGILTDEDLGISQTPDLEFSDALYQSIQSSELPGSKIPMYVTFTLKQ